VAGAESETPPPGDAASGHAYLESLRAGGLLRPNLLKIYVASIILGRAADRVFDTAYLRTLGISNREFESLITMFVWGHKYRKPGALAGFLGMSPAGITSLVDRLEQRGLVKRELDPADARVRLITPTDRGLELADAGLRLQLEWINETIGAALTEAQAAMLEELLYNVLQKVNPGYEPPPVDL